MFSQILTESTLRRVAVDNLPLLVHHVVYCKTYFLMPKFCLHFLWAFSMDFVSIPASIGSSSLIRAADNPLDPFSAEEAHQFVLQRNKELGGSGVSLTSGTPSQLIVNPSRFMAFRTYDIKAAELLDPLLLISPFRFEACVEFMVKFSCLNQFGSTRGTKLEA